MLTVKKRKLALKMKIPRTQELDSSASVRQGVQINSTCKRESYVFIRPVKKIRHQRQERLKIFMAFLYFKSGSYTPKSK